MRIVERYRPWLYLCLALLRVCLPAQTPTPIAPARTAIGSSANAFPNEPVVILETRSVTTMRADGTGVRENSIAARLQTDAAVRQFGVVNLAFAGSAEHAEFVYVRVRHADGAVVDTPVSGALEQPAEVTREAPFYSDLKTLQLPIKNLTVGDTLEWKARVTRTRSEAPGQFWGQEAFVSDGIALQQTFELHVPASVKLTLWTNPDVTSPKDTTSGQERTITWTSSHLIPSTGPDADARKKKLLTPEQNLAITKGPLPSFAWSTFPSWDAVAAWYDGLQADRVHPDPTISAKVAELTVGKTSDTEKAQAIYDYVSTRIRYIGVAFGVGRYQPHTAAEVLANQYGDCKDKHTLLAAMLIELGLHPEASLIGAGIRFNVALPSPGAFNHLITHVTVEGKPVWLDTTAEVAPWGTLIPLLRDQQALVVTPKSTASIQQTPAAAPYASFSALTATETLDKSLTSDAKITVTFHDDDEITLRSVLRQVSPAQYPELVQRLMASMGFGGTTSDPEISRPDDLEHPLTLTYHYKRIKEADWGENRVTEPFWPITLPTVNEKDPPVATIQLGLPRTETSRVEMHLPAGWSAELPEAIHAKSAFATADTTFHLKDGVVIAERKLTVLQSGVPASEWKAYKKWMEDGEVTGYPFVQLLPGSGAAAASAKASDHNAAGNAAAGRLVKQATDALRTMDTSTATRLLDQARDLNPNEPMLWGEYAFAAYLKGEISKATEAVNKELSLHPGEVQMNGLLATLQEARHENDAALASLHRWADGAADDATPEVALVAELHTLKRDDDAIHEGQTALARLSGSSADLTRLRLTLADVQAKVGKKSDAAETVRPLKTNLTDLSQQNSVAYILADAKVDLPEDESVERALLQQLDQETGSWTLDEAPATLKFKTSLLIASWDTMGWILYQQGHLSEARNFIAAAWRNASRADLLEHLHAVDSALHQTTHDEEKSEQSRRTFTLGPAKGKKGTAELRLLLGNGKVLRAEPLASATHPNAPSLSNAAEIVTTADLSQLFPANSKAHFVRQGIVNCVGTTCQLVLEPLSLR